MLAMTLSKDFENLSTPSSSRSFVTFSKSMPKRDNWLTCCRASSTLRSIVLLGLPWFSMARMVAGGTVSTVSGPMSESQYIVSGYDGSLVLVLPHSTGCICAPCFASVSHRVPLKIF
jgi:hypothetical protein